MSEAVFELEILRCLLNPHPRLRASTSIRFYKHPSLSSFVAIPLLLLLLLLRRKKRIVLTPTSFFTSARCSWNHFEEGSRSYCFEMRFRELGQAWNNNTRVEIFFFLFIIIL